VCGADNPIASCKLNDPLLTQRVQRPPLRTRSSQISDSTAIAAASSRPNVSLRFMCRDADALCSGHGSRR